MGRYAEIDHASSHAVMYDVTHTAIAYTIQTLTLPPLSPAKRTTRRNSIDDNTWYVQKYGCANRYMHTGT